MAEQHRHHDPVLLRQKLNLESGRISWSELQRHYARGVVVILDSTLDLIDVAARFAEDDKQSIEDWISQGKITRATDSEARRWQRQEPVFWAVVVAPWIMVQEGTPAPETRQTYHR